MSESITSESISYSDDEDEWMNEWIDDWINKLMNKLINE